MRKLTAVSLIAASALSLAACQEKPADNTTIVNEEVTSNETVISEGNTAEFPTNDVVPAETGNAAN